MGLILRWLGVRTFRQALIGVAGGAAADREPRPRGVVLAGGLGRRIGGSKALVRLERRPLISYPLEALWRALGNVAVVAKIDTELPSLPGVEVWVEPGEPRHPLTGIVHALSLADGDPVMVCAADMPLVSPDLVGSIATADPGDASAVVATVNGSLQPLLACYQPAALEPLSAAIRGEDPLRETVAALRPVHHEVEDRDALFNVNTPSDLLQAASMLDGRRARAVRAAAPSRT
jgi:molybdopterin-guanine dinucleotide biosynthesis protein A